MKKLSNDLKRILSGLAHQDDGEFLSMDEKMKALGVGSDSRVKSLSPTPSLVRKTVTQRIALISDGRGLGAPLDYAIDACSRQASKIDLLIHDAVDTSHISAIEKKIQEADLDYQRIQLGSDVTGEIVSYIHNHPSLIFLVALPDDGPVKVLIEEVIPKRGGRIPVPLVLIEDRASPPSANQSVA